MEPLYKPMQHFDNRQTDKDTSLYQPYIKKSEEIITDFRFEPIDEQTLKALDSILSIMFENSFDEIERCKIYSKLLEDRSETYILIKREDREFPFTFMVTCLKDNMNKSPLNESPL